MPSTAAVLNVLVEANTRGAQTSLNKFNTALTRTDKRTVSATTRTNQLGRATRSAGGHLASAARWAAGAAAAYLSISQAKAAVTTTQDLAKTTAGLNRNLGFATKEASRWAAVAKSRDVDGKALTMGFTTLSRRLVDTAHALREGGGAAETAMVPFTRLGFTQREIIRGSKDLNAFLPKLADSFGDAEGGAKRQASAQQLLGRGYQTLLPLFADGAKGLKEQQMWADKYGVTLNDKTLKAQMDLISAQRESKVAWIGLQTTFAQAVTPTLEQANKQFQRIAEIIASDKLTDDQKFKRVGNIIEDYADQAFDAFVGILPSIVERAGEYGPRIAEAIWEGFKEAPIWSKVAIGAFLFTKFGGGRAVGSAVGSALGTRLGGGAGLSTVATKAAPLPVYVTNPGFMGGGAAGGAAAGRAGAAGAAAGTGLRGALGRAGMAGRFGAGVAGRALGWLGVALLVDDLIVPDSILPETIPAKKDLQPTLKVRLPDASDTFWGQRQKQFIKLVQDTVDKAGKAVSEGVGGGPLSKGLGFAKALEREGILSRSAVGKILEQLDELPKGARKRAADTAIGMAKQLEEKGRLPEGSAERLRDSVLGRFQDMHVKSVDQAEKMTREAGMTMNELKNSGIKAFERMEGGISGSVDNLGRAVGRGFRGIFTNLNQALSALDIDAVAFSVAQGVNSKSDTQKKRSGGVIVPGRGSGDRVPAMLEPGEVVLNRNAVAALGGAARANSINRMIPRFAGGGMVTGDTDYVPALGSALNAMAAATGRSIYVNSGRRTMAEQTALYNAYLAGTGNLAAPPSPNAPHVQGIAADIAPGRETFGSVAGKYGLGFTVPSESWHIQLLGKAAAGAAAAIGAGAPVPNIARVLLEGPDGPLKSMGQAALDKVTKAARAYIAKQMPTGGAGGAASATPVGGGALSKAQVRSLLGKVGLPDIMGYVAYAESGFNPNAHNASGASGLWQIMMPLHQGIVNGNVFDPLVNAQAAKTLYSQSGLGPWAASKYEGQGGGWAQHLGQAFKRGGIARRAAGWNPTYGDQIPPAGTYGGRWERRAYRAIGLMERGRVRRAARIWNSLPDRLRMHWANTMGFSVPRGWSMAEDASIMHAAGGGIAKLARGTRGGGKFPIPGQTNPFYTGATSPQSPGGNISGFHTTASAAWTTGIPGGIPKRLRNRLAALVAFQTNLEEQIANREATDAFMTSPAGADLSSAERSGQVGLNQTLLANYLMQTDLIRRGLRTRNLKAQAKTRLTTALTTLQGVTGQGGLVLGVRQKLDSLLHPESAGLDTGAEDARKDMLIGLLTQGLGQANLRTAVSQAQYGVLSSGGMATGGVVGGSTDVRVYMWPDGKGASVSVNGQSFDTQVEQATRGMARRPLGAARGY